MPTKTDMNIKPVTTSRDSFGYVLEIPYTWSFFKYQSPILLSHVASLNGFDAPAPGAPFTHCDLGCGNGVTSNLLASAYPHASFFGLDFNPEHIRNARSLAKKAGLSNVTFVDASFDEIFEHNPPQFDYITLHGVYSWVDQEVRDHIDKVIARLLKPGGLVYLCYNALPGAANLSVLWKMMQAYSANLDGDVVSNAQAALRSMVELRDNDGRFFRENPTASAALDKMLKRDAAYLVHDFSNGRYEPQYFWDVATKFEALGLQYSGSARLHRNSPKNYIPSRHLAHVDGTKCKVERESRASFARNESFRWDVFSKSAKSEIGMGAQPLDAMLFGLAQPRHLLGETADVGRHQVVLSRGLAAKVLKALEGGALTLGELATHSEPNDMGSDQLAECVFDLVAAGCLQPLLAPLHDVKISDKSVYRIADPMNLTLIEERLLQDQKTYVSSPVSGTAHRLNFANGLYVWATHGNPLSRVQEIFEGRLHELVKDGLVDSISEEEVYSAEWLLKQKRAFFRDYLPRLIELGVLVPQ